MTGPQKALNDPRPVVRWLFRSAVTVGMMAAALFIGAGTTDWLQAWIYLGMNALHQALTAIVLIPGSRELVVERSRITQQGTKPWDIWLVYGMALFGPLLTWIIAGLDHRFYWIQLLSPALTYIGLGLAFLGALLTLWAMKANPFFAATVRIQSERGQQAISAGPYRLVRHPGYAGSLLFILATPLALGSAGAFFPAFATAIITITRAYLEDRTLHAELPGYREYAAKVHWKLIPFIW